MQPTLPPPIVDIMMARFGRELEIPALVRQVRAQPDLPRAADALEQAAARLTRSTQAIAVVRDGVRLWSPTGRPLDDDTRQAVDAAVAYGYRVQRGAFAIQPIGKHGALVVRRPPLVHGHGPIELAALAAIASAVAPLLERLVRDHALDRALNGP